MLTRGALYLVGLLWRYLTARELSRQAVYDHEVSLLVYNIKVKDVVRLVSSTLASCHETLTGKVRYFSPSAIK